MPGHLTGRGTDLRVGDSRIGRLSLAQTALAIGRSVSATGKLRNRPRREAAGELTPRKRKRELRNRAAANLERESALLDEVTGAVLGGVIVIPALKPAFEKALDRPVALSTLYRILARHGFRKLAPDTAHPKGDPQGCEDWKKNSPASWRRS